MSTAKSFFRGLNYSLANEDSWIEYRLAPQDAESIFSISGSGSRVLPLLAKSPKSLEVGDLSREQLMLCELRVEAVRALNYEEFLFFMGYRGSITDGRASLATSRWEYFEKLRLQPETRRYWNEHREVWEPSGFVYLGKWERHFMTLGRILKRYMRLNAEPLFRAHTLEEQLHLYRTKWSEGRFRAFIRIALSEYVFNRFLYQGHFAGSSDRRTVQEPTWKMVDREISKRLREQLPRKNFFLQMIFLGEVRYEEGLPCEATSEIFHAAKSALHQGTEVRYTLGNFLEITRERSFDFYSLSDTITYVSEEDAREFTARLPAGVSEGALIVIRAFMRHPHLALSSGWRAHSSQSERLAEEDSTGMYQFSVLSKTHQSS